MFRSPSRGITPVIFSLIRGKDTKEHVCQFYVILSIRSARIFNEYVIVLEQGAVLVQPLAPNTERIISLFHKLSSTMLRNARIPLWAAYDESKHFFLASFFITYMPNYFINLTRVVCDQLSQRHLDPLIGFKHFLFPGTDMLSFVSAEDVASYFVNRRAKMAVPLYMPGANNYFSYFTVEAFSDFCQCSFLVLFCLTDFA